MLYDLSAPSSDGPLKSSAKACTNKCELSLTLEGRIVHVSSCLCPWASVHSKANKNWQMGLMGYKGKYLSSLMLNTIESEREFLLKL